MATYQVDHVPTQVQIECGRLPTLPIYVLHIYKYLCPLPLLFLLDVLPTNFKTCMQNTHTHTEAYTYKD